MCLLRFKNIINSLNFIRYIINSLNSLNYIYNGNVTNGTFCTNFADDIIILQKINIYIFIFCNIIMSSAKFVQKVPFVTFPLNKSVSGYSYASGNPTINIQSNSVKTSQE
jgi:hypothetical protein